MMSDGVGDFIRVQRQLGHLSLRKLAELSDVSNAYLSQVERGLYTPSAQVMKNIAHALDLSAEALYSRAGLLDDETKADTRRGGGGDPARRGARAPSRRRRCSACTGDFAVLLDIPSIR